MLSKITSCKNLFIIINYLAAKYFLLKNEIQQMDELKFSCTKKRFNGQKLTKRGALRKKG
jgi:hypothetical protein